MSFRANLMRAIRGFDERFGYPCIYEEKTSLSSYVTRDSGFCLSAGDGVPHRRCVRWAAGARLQCRPEVRGLPRPRLLFANNCPRWQFPLFLLGNLVLAARPLIQFRGRDASRACAGLFTASGNTFCRAIIPILRERPRLVKALFSLSPTSIPGSPPDAG